MKIQPVHYIWEKTPLVYYRLVRVFSVVGIFAALGSIFIWADQEFRLWSDLVYDIAMFLIISFSAVNLADRRWSGAVAWYYSYLISFVYQIAVFTYFAFSDVFLFQFIPQIIVNIVCFFLVRIYFHKRRPLFSPWHGEPAYVSAPSSDESPSNTSCDVSPGEVDSLVAEMDEITSNAPRDTSSAPTSNGSTKPRFDFKKASDMLNRRPISSQETIYRCCPQCGQLLPFIQRKCDCGYQFSKYVSLSPKNRVSFFIAAVLSVVSILLCIALSFSFFKSTSLSKELDTANAELKDLQTELKNLQAEYDGLSGSMSMAKLKIDVLDKQLNDAKYNTFILTIFVGALVESDDYFYHTPQCNYYEENSGWFGFYPVTMLSELGFSPCPECHTSEEIMQIYNLVENESN